MNEIYKKVKGWETKYLISNLGNVKSLPNGSRKGIRLLKQEITKNTSYNRVTFCKKGKTTRFLVHRLVATLFIPNPLNKPQVNHIDNNRANNNVINLEWVTGKENMLHSSKQGRQDLPRKLGTKAASDKNQKEKELYYKNMLKDRFVKTYVPIPGKRRIVHFLCRVCNLEARVTVPAFALNKGGICRPCSYKVGDIVRTK